MRFVLLILMLFAVTSCYTVNPDGTVNIPQRTLDDIQGRWIGFNENFLVGFRMDVGNDGKGKAVIQLFDQIGNESDVNVKIDSNTVTVVSKEFATPLVFELEPTLMTMVADQRIDGMIFKVALVKKEHLNRKIEQLTK